MPHCITSIQRARRDHSKGRGTLDGSLAPSYGR
ncbi:hypothetical protein CABS01_15849 [Colletotrichum abscissum]|nr:uncharacterized protein CABS01_15849 [Colletotrichum abscissum]KAK1474387.1 hypothetical protein CABS01_15849 [Colletotrichum abscissum]